MNGERQRGSNGACQSVCDGDIVSDCSDTTVSRISVMCTTYSTLGKGNSAIESILFRLYALCRFISQEKKARQVG